MKIIRLPRCRGHILSPWLSIEDAAAYLDVSHQSLRQLLIKYPCSSSGTGKMIKYHAKELDKWWKALPKKETEI